METKLLAMGSLEQRLISQGRGLKVREHHTHPFARRNFLRLAGIGMSGLAISWILESHDALACLVCAAQEAWLHTEIKRQELMLSSIRELALQRSRWRVEEPTTGTITLINPSDISASGQVVLAVVERGNIEDLQRRPYTVLPQEARTFPVYDGPRARRPGQKSFVLATNNDLRSTSMVAYV